jgi:hypothetical protein
MFRRLTWLGVGLVAGAAGSKWVEIKARRRLARYFPPGSPGSSALKAAPEIAGRALEVAVDRVADFRNAVEGGHDAMVRRESELRRQLRLTEPGERARSAP